MKKIVKTFIILMIFGVFLSMTACINNETKKYTITLYTNTDSNKINQSYEENTVLTEDMLPVLTKEGYTKEKWYLDSEFKTKVEFPYTVIKNTSFYLKWIKNIEDTNNYSITFVDGTNVLLEATTENQKIAKPEDPVKTGYTFKGWFSDDKFSTAFDFTKEVSEDTTVYAKFEILKLKVQFMDGNTILSSKTVDYNLTVSAPQNEPTKNGYIFDGWYTDTEYTDQFNFNDKITTDTKIYAHFIQIIDGQINILKSGGYNEGAYVEFTKIAGTSLDKYEVYYKKSNSTNEVQIDSELIRENNTTIRADIIGLPHGTYDIIIKVANSDLTKTVSNVEVFEEDRSGYAHFKATSGIGAYNNDGTLKSNAVVVYVNDNNKNTVTATLGGKKYTGLSAIIKACTKSSYALDIRILGEIQTTQWNAKSHGTGNTTARQNNLEALFNYKNDTSGWDEKSSGNYSKLSAEEIIKKGINSMSSDEAKGITKLDGLTTTVLRNKKADDKTGAYEYDSYYNMLDVSGAYNITIEGVGTDAAIFQWGFAFKKCNNIEIKNIYFHNYTEDAVGFEGASNSDIDYGNYWIHNCTFDIGVNNWDVCYEADKGDGDGSSDLKYCHNVTISYCQYNKTHKTNLIGSSDSAKQYNITLHHNYYNECGSRLPLVRQANIHMYNNYYYKSTGYCSSIRSNAFAFVENCYYDNAKNPYETVTNAVLKSYGNIYNNCSISGSYTKENTVSSRTEATTEVCSPVGDSKYCNFDTNKDLFYYDSTNKVSDVKDLLEASEVPNHCKKYSGVLKGDFTGNKPSTDIDKPTDTTWNTALNQDFSSNSTITKLESNSTPTSAGIYYYTNGGDSTTNNLQISNGSLKINDTSTTATTYGYYMFGNSYSTGKVRISIDFTPQTSNGKWTMIHFLDNDKNIGIRTAETTKYLGYTLDNGTTVTAIDTEALVANKTYTIVVTIDYNTGSGTISINNHTISFSGYTSAIKGLMFQTATGERSFSVDNLKVEIAE